MRNKAVGRRLKQPINGISKTQNKFVREASDYDTFFMISVPR